MRRRSTFIHDTEFDFNPAEIRIKGEHLSFSGLKAAREEQLTYGFNELPVELLDVLQQSQEIHIRWSSHQAYNKTIPYLSSLTPGLHVSYRPLGEKSNDLLCPLLRKAFSKELKCVSPAVSFTKPDSDSAKSGSDALSQFYAPLPSVQQLVAYLQRNICPRSDVSCFHTVSLLNIADYIDFDYDNVSHALKVTAFWSKPPAVLYDPIGDWTTYDHWNLAVESLPNDRNEVGVLASARAADPHDLQLEGFLTVVGEDEQPKPTMFFFPSRHHVLPMKQAASQQYNVSFLQPTGLHPTLQISFPSAAALQEPSNRSAGSCALHAYFTLPSVIFADEYIFASDDQLFFEAHNLRNLRAISGERDLEAPDYVVSAWGSTLLLELAAPPPPDSNTASKTETWDVTVPLHLRYLEPSAGGQVQVDIPWPVVFWACPADADTTLTGNPFDRTHLGYDSLFDTGTMFYHLNPQLNSLDTAQLVASISVPVLDTAQMSSRTVEIGTLAAILLGFAWILKALWPGLMAQLDGRHTDQRSENKKEQ